LPVLEEINMLSSDLAAGEGSVLIEGKQGSFGSVICFESLFPSLTRQSVKDGAEMIVLVTNDSWYKDSPGVWQHLAHAVFRSVENSRSTARCANSGVSAFIDSRGRLTSVLGPLEKGILTDSVSFSDETTLYTLWGDLLLPCLVALWMLSAVPVISLERRRKDAR
ncbi:MAG: apolipoprotein N-acyltransferase, partial [Clostridia bacterium]|nr:apolipoprotein N-acyltransferase [Clostridia bacterium]